MSSGWVWIGLWLSSGWVWVVVGDINEDNILNKLWRGVSVLSEAYTHILLECSFLVKSISFFPPSCLKSILRSLSKNQLCFKNNNNDDRCAW